MFTKIFVLVVLVAFAQAQFGGGGGGGHHHSAASYSTFSLAGSGIAVPQHHEHHHYEQQQQQQQHHQQEHHGHHEEVYVDYHSHPKYEYKYGVEDPHTHDKKHQHESRDGHNTKGEYTVVEPDGTVLHVHYTVGGKSGFNAIVSREGHATHPPPKHHH